MVKKTWGLMILLLLFPVSLIATESTNPIVLKPFSLILPPGYKPPIETTSVSGSTYTYLPTEEEKQTRLTVTVLQKDAVQQQTGTLDSSQCARIFLDEIHTAHQRFFVTVMVRPISVGQTSSPQFRWSGEKNEVPLTGVLTCVLLEEAYLIFNLTDHIEAASKNFPALRQSIRNITFR